MKVYLQRRINNLETDMKKLINDVRNTAPNISAFTQKLKHYFKKYPLLEAEIYRQTAFLDNYYDDITLNQRTYHIWKQDFSVRMCQVCGDEPATIHYRTDGSGDFEKYNKLCENSSCLSESMIDTRFNSNNEKF